MIKPKILIIDDEVDIAETLAYILQAKGFKAIIATNGAEGLNRIEKENPDMVLLDIMMPVMDGYQVCETMKRSSKTKAIPIIIVSSSGDTDSVVKAYKSGANDYIVKPFNIVTLISKMRKFL